VNSSNSSSSSKAPDPVEFEKLDAQLRAGEVPECWRSLLGGEHPSILLIMMWAGRLARRVEAFYQQVLRPYGLQYPDYTVLSMLRFSGPMSPKKLNAFLAITAGGLTKSIDRLERAKLARRSADPADGRGTLVTLTRKGERMFGEVFGDDLEAHRELFQDLRVPDQNRIATALRELLDTFEAPRSERGR
jgi:DNA-binding MarR family transcriptional regulator